MTRTMYDAITPSNIPVTAQMVAGYVDGRYAWSSADWARFPHSVKARIAVFSSTADGHILDVEAGCSTPGNAPGWVVRRRAAGIDPTVYCSLSAWPTVRAAFATAHVAEPHWWVAAYPGNGAQLYPGSIAHQYANPGPVDISVVADYWPGVDPKPAPTAPTGDTPMSAAEVQTILTALASHEKNELGRYGSEGARYADLAGRAATQLAQIAALTAAVAALAAHPDLTADQITTIISDAITASVKVTGTLTVVQT